MINLNKFSNLIGLMESGGRYTAINSQSGALGKYQFLPATLNALQFKYNLPAWLGSYNFLNSPAMQDIYFEAHTTDLLSYINQNNLNRFNGRSVTGSMRFRNITTSINQYGLMAAAHLAGTNALRNYFNNGYDPDDGLTSLSDYMAYFSKQMAAGGYLLPVAALAILSIIVIYYN